MTTLRTLSLSILAAATAVVTMAGPALACPPGDDDAATPTRPAVEQDVIAHQIRALPEPPSTAIKGVRVAASLPDAKGAISLGFLTYGHRKVMYVSGTFGLKTYDVTDPAAPQALGSLSMPGMWETEDTEADPQRKLVFMARDPRAFGGNTHTGESGVYIVSLADPAKPVQLAYEKVPTGHTTSCVDDCRYLWTGGPAKADWMPADWGGRPVWVTDVRDPRHPRTFPQPIELGRNDGTTDYVHDIQVDAAGVTWASGRGGVRGYWTQGLHWDPVRHTRRVARAWDPVPYAGGGISETAAPSKFMHNSFRPVGSTADEAPGNGDLVYITEEAFNPGCADDGRLVIASLRGSYGGEGWRSTPNKPFRLRTVGTWSVAGQEGSRTDTDDCSAHYFAVHHGILVQSFYTQGTRFLDVRDPAHPRQVAYYRPADAMSWAPYWHDGYVYVADNTRGIDILRPEVH
ncbi:MAG: LVIVD repeat-containing protein [Actinoallomurus sp.]